jgi:hypothetical protein
VVKVEKIVILQAQDLVLLTRLVVVAELLQLMVMALQYLEEQEDLAADLIMPLVLQED